MKTKPKAKKSATIGTAAAALRAEGMPVNRDFLRRIKGKYGEQAGFESSGRVVLAALRRIVRIELKSKTTTPGDSRQSLEQRRLAAQCEAIERDNKVRAETLIEKTAIAAQAVNYLAEIKPLLYQRVGYELPALTIGMSVDESRKKHLEVVEIVLSKFRDFAALFTC